MDTGEQVQKIVVVDIEADGPCPGLYNLLEIGAVTVSNESFYVKILPITDNFNQDALNSIGMSKDDRYVNAIDPKRAMELFSDWVSDLNAIPIFMSDNNGFDWQFVNYYFHKYLGFNPFGFSSGNIGWLYKGIKKDYKESFKKLRKTKHDHNPLNDAKGNLEALLEMQHKFGMKLPL